MEVPNVWVGGPKILYRARPNLSVYVAEEIVDVNSPVTELQMVTVPGLISVTTTSPAAVLVKLRG